MIRNFISEAHWDVWALGVYAGKRLFFFTLGPWSFGWDWED